MASIEERPTKDGKMSYQVNIRRKGIEIYKTFYERQDAVLYSYYKERLIDNMHNFDVDLKDRIRISDLFELKISSIDSHKKREILDLENSMKKLNHFLNNKFLCQITFEEWLETAKKLISMDVYRGAKTEKSKRTMSFSTLRKIYAYASSCISYAKSKGIVLENHPLKVIQCFINANKSP